MDQWKTAVNEYYQAGWVCQPLVDDDKGLPKRAIVRNWQRLTRNPKQIAALPWNRATGLGILLGPTSGNLAAIDVDDEQLSHAVLAALVRGHVYTRIVWTRRKRIHVYFKEATPSRPRNVRIRQNGEMVTVELRAQGQQVTAPPTPGYVLCLDKPVLEVPSIGEAWESLSRKLGLEEITEGYTSAGFPKPWQPEVLPGDRNQAAYIEAHKLREAGMPYEQAADIMRVRWEAAYDKAGMAWRDLDLTIRSAYRKSNNEAKLIDLYKGWEP